MRKVSFALLGFVGLALIFAQMTRSPSAEGASVYFINIEDGAEVSSPLFIQFGLRGMGVAPAGAVFEGTGHHHLLINTDVSTLDMTLPLPATDQVVHYGKGQTEAMLELPPGEHSLQLLLGDFSHIPHEPALLSEKITITVIE